MNYQISKSAFMMDFWVYPLLAVPLGMAAIARSGSACWVLVPAGVLAWSLTEYVVHRWLLHGESSVAHEHHEHHVRPAEFIGLPGWQSLLAFAGLSVAAWLVCGGAAFALLLGFMVGYYIYLCIHYACHHLRIPPGHWLFRLKLRHVRHHAAGHVNFGVITPLWDRVFRTAR